MSAERNEELVKYLRQNGPTQIRQLRDITKEPPRRHEDVQDFRINPSRSSGSSVSSSGTPLRIAYLEDEHEPTEILRVWEKHHQEMIQTVSADAIYRATPDEFRDAMREIVDVDEYYSGRGGDNSSDVSECSLCGQEYEGDLPTHLEKDCSG